MSALKKFIPFAKVDEAKREVWGIVTAEVKDKDGETCRYAPTVENYKAWVGEFQKATAGDSFGNLREMHQLKAAGRGVGIEYRDADKEIWMGFKVVDDDAWKKVAEKVYTGFSQGGEYQDGPDVNGFYTAKPSEVSLVDNPCLGVAHFAFIRATGAVEMVKIRSVEDTQEQPMNAATKAYLDAALADLLKANRGDLSLAKKATIHGHLTKAMEHHEKMGACLQDCMKAMGHEGEDEDDMDKAQARKAATDAGLSGAALETFLQKFTAEEKPAEETPEQKARKAGEAGGLTGAALEEFVAKTTGKVQSITKAEVAQIVGDSIKEAMGEFVKALTVTRGAPSQTSIPVKKADDGKTPEEIKKAEEARKAADDEKDPVAVMKATQGLPLDNETAFQMRIVR